MTHVERIHSNIRDSGMRPLVPASSQGHHNCAVPGPRE